MNREQSLLEYKRRICLAINHIDRHLDENPTLEEIAAAAFFSKYHFHRIFHLMVGETVACFVRRLRLERAANFLLFSVKMDVTTIAHTCGFSSSQNFAKAFSHHFGMSPTSYRRQYRKDGNSGRKGGNAADGTFVYDVEHVNWHTSPNERSHTMNVEIKQLPSRHLAYVRQIGPYGPEGCGAAHQRLMQWAGPRGMAKADFSIGISWDNPEVTPAQKCRYDACLPVPEGTRVDGEVGLQKLSGGNYAVYRVTVGTDGFGQAWEDFMGGWLPQSGYQCADGPCFEICHNHNEAAGEDRWEVEICCPVEPL